MPRRDARSLHTGEPRGSLRACSLRILPACWCSSRRVCEQSGTLQAAGVRIAQLALQHLADRAARQLRQQLDGMQALELAETLVGPIAQRARIDGASRNDEC